MHWATENAFVTITGVDIALWLLAYAAWRYLTGASWKRKPDVASEGAPMSATVPGLSSYRTPGERWARRASIIEKVRRPATRKATARRRLKRAA